ncbi:MAG: exonuclease domain-containing protein [Candidatus Magasanikbacteria bacterium]
MKILFLDTETTDLDKDTRMIQLAYKNRLTGDTVNEYFKPPKEISVGAMSIHHVTNEMVKDKPSFANSQFKKDLEILLEDYIVVAHNAIFDIGVLQNEGLKTKEYIDTLRVARHVVESPEHKLQYLRYLLKLNVEGLAHDAWGDILVLEALFEYLFPFVKNKFLLITDEEVLGKMKELTVTPVPLKNFTFGKHNGKSFEEVSKIDKSYLDWLYNSEMQKPEEERKEDMIFTLKFYLGK